MTLVVHATVEHLALQWGGIATAVGLAAVGCVRSGHPTMVVSLDGADETLEDSDGVRLTTIHLPGLAGSLYTHRDRVPLGRQASERMIEAIDAQRDGREVALVIHSDELVRLAELRKTLPWITACVAVTHGTAAEEHPDNPSLWAQQQHLFDLVDHVFTVSDAQRRQLISAGLASERVSHLPLPLVLLGESGQVPSTRSPASIRRGLVVAAGRAVSAKGFDLLLDAMRLLDGSCTLTLAVGHGPLQEQIAGRACSVRGVETLPWLARDELLQLMTSAHVVVVPSRFEPLGLIAAEAIAAGVPVLVSDVGGLPELVTDPSLGSLLPVAGADGPDPRLLTEAIATAVTAAPAVMDGRAALSRFSVERFDRALSSIVGG